MGYFSSYELSDGSTNTHQNSNTNSSSYGFKESVSGTLTYGMPDFEDVSVSVKASSQQNLDHVVNRKFGQSSSQTFMFSEISAYTDFVVFRNPGLNLLHFHFLEDTVAVDTDRFGTQAHFLGISRSDLPDAIRPITWTRVRKRARRRKQK